MTFSQTPLDKDRYHIRRIYEAYGEAMYQAQCLEKQLAMIYAVHSKQQKRVTIKELQKRFYMNFDRTFG